MLRPAAASAEPRPGNETGRSGRERASPTGGGRRRGARASAGSRRLLLVFGLQRRAGGRALRLVERAVAVRVEALHDLGAAVLAGLPHLRALGLAELPVLVRVEALEH